MWVRIKSGGVSVVRRGARVNSYWQRVSTSGRIGLHVNGLHPQYNYTKILIKLGL